MSGSWKLKESENVIFGEKTAFDICCNISAITRLHDLYPNCKIIMF